MSGSIKKPFYKQVKWWTVFIVAIMIFYFIGTMTEDEDQIVEEEKQEETKEKESEEDNEKEEKSNSEVEHESLTFPEFSIENIVTKLDDGELVLKFRWINQSGDKAPFTSLGYIDASQGSEVLDEVSGAYDQGNKTEILFQNANGGGHAVTLVYEVMNQDDVELLFSSTLEESDKKETITVELE